MTNKQKKKIKVIISITIFVVSLIVAGVTLIAQKLTTPPSLSDVISAIEINTSEISMNVTVSNEEGEINFFYIVSEKEDYIKTVKEVNGDVVTNIVFKVDEQYYLYQETTESTLISLSELDGKNFINNLKNEVIDLNVFLNVNYEEIKYYSYSEDVITYSNYKNNIFYDNTIKFNNNVLTEITQVYTINNTINTVKMTINSDFTLEIPNLD